jgi:twitching motility protein PilT
MNLPDLLRTLVERGASDVHLHAGQPPLARIAGALVPFGEAVIPAAFTERLVEAMCDEPRLRLFERDRQIDLAYEIAGLGRFRVNLFRQQGRVSAVLRVVASDDAVLRVVDLPAELIAELTTREQGIVLVTGPTGSGKSTTLARLIDEINAQAAKMIVTIEDPIEFIHRPKRSVVVQREIPTDARSFADALVAAMRQDPDVVLIGEIRDHATAAAALSAAQTGHLVFATMHTQDTARTIHRMLDLFPPDERDAARVMFAEALVAIVAQRLLPRAGGRGRVAAIEVLKGTLRVRDLVRSGASTEEYYDAIRDGRFDGMQLFDDHLAHLYGSDAVSFDAALAAATSAQRFKMAATQVDLGRGRSSASPFG